MKPDTAPNWAVERKQREPLGMAGILFLAIFAMPRAAAGQSCALGADFLTIQLPSQDTVNLTNLRYTGDSAIATVIGRGRNPAPGLLVMIARFSPARLIKSMRIKSWASLRDSAGPPTREISVVVGDRLISTTVWVGGRAEESVEDSVETGTLPFFDSAPAAMEFLLQRARYIGLPRTTVPLFWPLTNHYAEPAQVLFPAPGMASVTTPFLGEVRITTDSAGGMREYTSSRARYVRTSCR